MLQIEMSHGHKIHEDGRVEKLDHGRTIKNVESCNVTAGDSFTVWFSEKADYIAARELTGWRDGHDELSLEIMLEWNIESQTHSFLYGMHMVCLECRFGLIREVIYRDWEISQS